jgi:hypothetical protein
MQKLILGLLLLTTCSLASAAHDIIINPENPDPELAKLSQSLIATLVDQGFEQHEVTNKVYYTNVSGLRCVTYSRDNLFPKSPLGGLPAVECTVKADSKTDREGVPVGDARYILSLIKLIEAKNDVVYTECKEDQCITYVGSIKCKADLNETELKKVHSCTFKKLFD